VNGYHRLRAQNKRIEKDRQLGFLVIYTWSAQGNGSNGAWDPKAEAREKHYRRESGSRYVEQDPLYKLKRKLESRGPQQTYNPPSAQPPVDDRGIEPLDITVLPAQMVLGEDVSDKVSDPIHAEVMEMFAQNENYFKQSPTDRAYLRGRTFRLVPFSDVPDIALKFGATEFVSLRAAIPPEERQMFSEHGIPLFFGECPDNYAGSRRMQLQPL
jgi:hypothetical protein